MSELKTERKEVPPSSVTFDLTKEAAFIYNLIIPNAALAKASNGITFQKAFNYAALVGSIDGLTALVKTRYVYEWGEVLNHAAHGGHVPVLDWLASQLPLAGHFINGEASSCYGKAFIIALNAQHIPVMEWIESRGYVSLDHVCMEVAQSGSSSVVEWISGKCFQYGRNLMFLTAALHGHIHILDFLSSKVSSDLYGMAFVNAALGNHILAMEWLISKGYILDKKEVLKEEHTYSADVLRWLSSKA